MIVEGPQEYETVVVDTVLTRLLAEAPIAKETALVAAAAAGDVKVGAAVEADKTVDKVKVCKEGVLVMKAFVDGLLAAPLVLMLA